MILEIVPLLHTTGKTATKEIGFLLQVLPSRTLFHVMNRTKKHLFRLRTRRRCRSATQPNDSHLSLTQVCGQFKDYNPTLDNSLIIRINVYCPSLAQVPKLPDCAISSYAEL